MKIFQTFAVIALVFGLSSCAQQPVPPPFQNVDRDPAEPVAPSRSAGPIDSQPGDSMSKPGPRPLTTPETDSAAAVQTVPDFKSDALSAGYVNDRIKAYNQKLIAWQQRDQQAAISSLDAQQAQVMVDCYRDLQGLLNGYQSLRDQIFASGGDPTRLSADDIIGLQRRDIDFVEGDCQQLLGGSGADGTVLMTDNVSGSTSQIEQMIDNNFQNGSFQEIIEAWSDIPPHQKERIATATMLQYADSLTYLDQPARAAEVYQQIVDGMSGAVLPENSLLALRKRLADLYVAAGDFFGAEGQYEELSRDYQELGGVDAWARQQLSMLERSMKGSPELTDYSELLREYLAYSPLVDGYGVVWRAETFLNNYPYSPVSTNVEIIKEETLQAADQWFERLLSEADQLVQNQQAQQAISALQTIPQDKLSPDKLMILKDKLDSLVLAEAVERETEKIETMQALQSTWNEGSARAESGDFDGAVQLFAELMGTEYEARARERIDELSLTAAKEERRRAADLFVRSTKTDDLDSQKELLAQSWQVLTDILVKYPNVEIADRVRSNIRTVEKKISEIEPLLLGELQERQQQKLELMPAASEPEIDGFDIESSGPMQPQSPSNPAPLPVYTPQALQLQ